MRRRELIKNAVDGAAAGVVLNAKLHEAVADARSTGLRVGMCDWMLDRRLVERPDPSVFELGKQIGLDGIEVSCWRPENMWPRMPEMLKKYVAAARKHGLAIPSVVMGVLLGAPLRSEPRAALYVADMIDMIRAFGARTLLLPFVSGEGLKEENVEDMRRVTEALAELAPRAEKAGVTLGLETFLSAAAHLKIIDVVKSQRVQVYYDVLNAAQRHHDVLKEIRLLGSKHICQVHFKDDPLLEKGSGLVDWPAVVAALKEIGYSGWIVLESRPPTDVVSDTKKNVAYVRKLFAQKP